MAFRLQRNNFFTLGRIWPRNSEFIEILPRIGDIVTFGGTLFGLRDLTQIYMFDQNHQPPVSLQDMPLLHTAPSLRKVGDQWEKVCVGTTTSVRMERFSPLLMQNYGVRAIIGKGGLHGGSLDAMQKYGAVYLAIVGGAAALETEKIIFALIEFCYDIASI